MKEYSVYMHVFPNGKRYIGITKSDPETRWANGFGYKTQFVFTAIVKYGWDNIEHYILHTGLSKKEAEKEERELIEALDTSVHGNGYNVDNGGSSSGTHSDDTKKKISKSKTGIRKSKEEIERLRIAMTPERKKKMINASIAKCSIPVLCVETGIIYQSASQASRELNIDKSSIGNCCKGKKRYVTAGGYHWKYADTIQVI